MVDARNKPVWRVLEVPAPAAGANFSIVPDTAAHWLIWTIRFTLATDANVANRHVVMTVANGTNDFQRYHAGSVQAASLTHNYQGSPGEQGNATTGVEASIHFPVSGIWIPQGYTLASAVANIQATDQISDIRGLLYEFPSGPAEFYWPLRPLIREESS